MNALILWYFLAIGAGTSVQVGPFYNENACIVAQKDVMSLNMRETACYANDMQMPVATPTPSTGPKKSK